MKVTKFNILAASFLGQDITEWLKQIQNIWLEGSKNQDLAALSQDPSKIWGNKEVIKKAGKKGITVLKKGNIAPASQGEPSRPYPGGSIYTEIYDKNNSLSEVRLSLNTLDLEKQVIPGFQPPDDNGIHHQAFLANFLHQTYNSPIPTDMSQSLSHEIESTVFITYQYSFRGSADKEILSEPQVVAFEYAHAGLQDSVGFDNHWENDHNRIYGYRQIADVPGLALEADDDTACGKIIKSDGNIVTPEKLIESVAAVKEGVPAIVRGILQMKTYFDDVEPDATTQDNQSSAHRTPRLLLDLTDWLQAKNKSAMTPKNIALTVAQLAEEHYSPVNINPAKYAVDSYYRPIKNSNELGSEKLIKKARSENSIRFFNIVYWDGSVYQLCVKPHCGNPSVLSLDFHTDKENKQNFLSYMKQVPSREHFDTSTEILFKSSNDSPYIKTLSFAVSNADTAQKILGKEATFLRKQIGNSDSAVIREQQSILSAGAYLYDLINILPYVKHKANDNELNPEATLIYRRPDIFEIPLNETETLSTRPQLEIINYVMARHIASDVARDKVMSQSRANEADRYWAMAAAYEAAAIKCIKDDKDAKKLFDWPCDMAWAQIQAYFKALDLNVVDLYDNLNVDQTDKDSCLVSARCRLDISAEIWSILSQEKLNAKEENESASFLPKTLEALLSTEEKGMLADVVMQVTHLRYEQLKQLLGYDEAGQQAGLWYINQDEQGNLANYQLAINNNAENQGEYLVNIRPGAAFSENNLLPLTADVFYRLGVLSYMATKMDCSYDDLSELFQSIQLTAAKMTADNLVALANCQKLSQQSTLSYRQIAQLTREFTTDDWKKTMPQPLLDLCQQLDYTPSKWDQAKQGQYYKDNIVAIATQLGIDYKSVIIVYTGVVSLDSSVLNQAKEKSESILFFKACYRLAILSKAYQMEPFELLEVFYLATQDIKKTTDLSSYLATLVLSIGSNLSEQNLVEALLTFDTINKFIQEASIKATELSYVLTGREFANPFIKVPTDKLVEKMSKDIPDDLHSIIEKDKPNEQAAASDEKKQAMKKAVEAKNKRRQQRNKTLSQVIASHLNSDLTVVSTIVDWLGGEDSCHITGLLLKKKQGKSSFNLDAIKLIHRIATLAKIFNLKASKRNQEADDLGILFSLLKAEDLSKKGKDSPLLNFIIPFSVVTTIQQLQALQHALQDPNNKFVKKLLSEREEDASKATHYLSKLLKLDHSGEQIKALIGDGKENTKSKNTVNSFDINKTKTAEDVIKVVGRLHTLAKILHPLQNHYDFAISLCEHLNDGKELLKDADKLNAIVSNSQLSDNSTAILSAKADLIELKRDVLSSYLLKQLNDDEGKYKDRDIKGILGTDFTNLSDLTDYLLVDVELSAKDQISPVAQAIYSMQTYLHRCQLGLEKDGESRLSVNISDNWWPWIQSYPYWKANRKLLIYPENYIQPDLRLQQSDEYKDLVKSLNHASMDDDMLDTVFRQYVNKLGILSGLNIAGSYVIDEKNEMGEDYRKLFLMGRTGHKPYEYYLRTVSLPKKTSDSIKLDSPDEQLDSKLLLSNWSYWQKVTTVIASPIVFPIHTGDRLYLFWVEVIQQAKDQGQKNTVNYVYQQIDGTWSSKQIFFHYDTTLELDDNGDIKNDEKYRFGIAYQKSALSIIAGYMGINNIQYKIMNNHFDVVDAKNLGESSIQNILPSDALKLHIDDNSVMCTQLVKSYTRKYNKPFVINYTLPAKKQTVNTSQNVVGLAAYYSLPNGTSGGEKLYLLGCQYAESSNEQQDQPPSLDYYWKTCEIKNEDDIAKQKAAPSPWEKIDIDPTAGINSAIVFPINTSNAFHIFWVEDYKVYYISKREDSPWTEKKGIYELPLDEEMVSAFKSSFNIVCDESDIQKTKIFFKTTFAMPLKPMLKYAEMTYNEEGELEEKLPQPNGNEFPEGMDPGVEEAMKVGIIDGKKLAAASKPYEFLHNNRQDMMNLRNTLRMPCSAETLSFEIKHIAEELLSESDKNNEKNESSENYDDISCNFGRDQSIKEKSDSNKDFGEIYYRSPVLLQQFSRRIEDNTIGKISSLTNCTWLSGDKLMKIFHQKLQTGNTKDLYKMFSNLESEVYNAEQNFWDLPSFKEQNIILLNGEPQVKDTDFLDSSELDEATIKEQNDDFINKYRRSIDLQGGFADYYWEMLFYVPWLIAKNLNYQQKYEQARDWMHFIFDPREPDAPFIFPGLNETANDKSLAQVLTNTDVQQIYHNRLTDPHQIAMANPLAYKKAIIMMYIQNLLDWGDFEFKINNRETITAALILYEQAAKLLGPRPKNLISASYRPTSHAASDFLTDNGITSVSSENEPFPYNYIDAYFGIEENPQFQDLWDTVEDRLFKIRHSLSIDGVFEQLDLFAPDIDPNDLLRAAAMGNIDMLSLMAGAALEQPKYRFIVLLARARSYNQHVQQLGASLMANIEKKESATLAKMNLSFELDALTKMDKIYQKNIEHANSQLELLKQQGEQVKKKFNHYQKLIDPQFDSSDDSFDSAKALTPGNSNAAYTMNDNEKQHTSSMQTAFIFNEIAQGATAAANALGVIPSDTWGMAAGVTFGGPNLCSGAMAIANVLSCIEEKHINDAQKAQTIASYERRQEEWVQLVQQCIDEYDDIRSRYNMASLQLDVEKVQYEHYQAQLNHQQDVLDYYQSRFTNEDLYAWFVDRLTGLYSQAFKLSYKLYQAAVNAYEWDIGTPYKGVAQYADLWDATQKGLTSGDNMAMELNYLEDSYNDIYKRRMEIDKNISLKRSGVQVAIGGKEPEIIKEKDWTKVTDQLNDGKKAIAERGISFVLGKDLFADFSNLTDIQIHSFAVSIPSVAKAYENVNLSLSYEKNISPESDGSQHARSLGVDTPKTVILSSGTLDSGISSATFSSDKYLPFEGLLVAGSQWRLNVCGKTDFKYNMISDVIMHFKLTAVLNSNSDSGKDYGTNTGGDNSDNEVSDPASAGSDSDADDPAPISKNSDPEADDQDPTVMKGRKRGQGKGGKGKQALETEPQSDTQDIRNKVPTQQGKAKETGDPVSTTQDSLDTQDVANDTPEVGKVVNIEHHGRKRKPNKKQGNAELIAKHGIHKSSNEDNNIKPIKNKPARGDGEKEHKDHKKVGRLKR